jgi:hypothetical protein
MMKQLSFSVIVIGLLFGSVFAYQPTTQDVTAITSLKNQLNIISSGDVQIK